MNILLIEPNRILANTYRQALYQAGHRVVWCASGQAGISAADEQVPDVLVLELQLPAHSGFEFLYEFRTYADWQQVPVILHTFVPDQFVDSQKELLGVAAYLYKPATSLERLVRAVNGAAEVLV